VNYGVVLLALGILALGVTLLALTWRRTPPRDRRP
jgi:hypothetical protein